VIPRAITTANSTEQFRYHNPDGTLEEGLAVLRRAIDETAQRLVVAPGNYIVKVVDKDGVREIKL
jgi:20S proteasome subunit beta 4